MIYHLVLMKVRPDARAEELERVFDALAGLRGKIPGLLTVSGGPYASDEGLSRGFTHGVCMTFADAEARDAYLPHPEHAAVKRRVLEILEGGLDGVLAFDFEA